MGFLPVYDWVDLSNLYLEKGLSGSAIARIKGCKVRAVYNALHRQGIPCRIKSEALKLAYKAENHSTRPHKTGYKRVKVPENYIRPVGSKYISEHILVWEKVHNIPLPKSWIVHHINGIKTDNRPSNLVGLPNRQHMTILAVKAQRIRELEEENRLLKKALDDGQMVFDLSEN